MQKYRADKAYPPQTDGAVCWYSDWMGGPSLAKIVNCRLIKLEGEPRATVYITGEPDTYFSIPAVCSYRGCRMRGYVTAADDGCSVFHHCYF